MDSEEIYYIKNQKQDPVAWIQGLNASGYAGITEVGMICDRREYPNAVPIQENTLFGVVKPKKLK